MTFVSEFRSFSCFIPHWKSLQKYGKSSTRHHFFYDIKTKKWIIDGADYGVLVIDGFDGIFVTERSRMKGKFGVVSYKSIIINCEDTKSPTKSDKLKFFRRKEIN